MRFPYLHICKSVICTSATRTGVAKLFLLFALLFTATVQAQPNAADTIRRQLAALNKEDPNYLDRKIGSLGTLFMSIVHSDPQEALRVNAQLVKCLEEKGDTAAYYEALYRHKAIVCEQLGDYTKYIFFLEAYAEALNGIGKENGYAYVDIGNAYYSFGLHELAKDSYRRADEVFAKTGNAYGQCTVHNNYAQIHMQAKQYDSALVELRQTLYLRRYKLKDEVIAGDSKLLMGVVFRDMGQYDSARFYLRQVLDILHDPALNAHTDHIALQEEYSGAYNHLALVFVSEKNWDSAAYYLRQGAPVYAASNYERRINASYGIWARIYLGRQQYDSAWANIRRMENAAGPRPSTDTRTRIYQLYSDYYKATGNLQEHYRYEMLYYRAEDSLRSVSLNEGALMAGSVMKELKNKSRIEHQQVELVQKDALVAKQEKEKLLLFALSGLFLVIIAGGFFFFFQIRQKNRLIERYNTELEEANATKEKFLSVISHDLRNPFNTLIGMSNVLVSNVKEKNLQQVVSNAEAINESSRKAYVLLDNLMQWVTLQKEKITVNRTTLEVNAMVEEVLRLFRNQALAQSITIRKDIRVAVISADRNLLQVVLRNLLSNAIRHIPVGGIASVCVEEAGADVRIVVEDNGRGIDEQTLATLFTKKDGTSIARKGGGLGLVLVQEFVEQMNGTIHAENIPGSGARFVILLRGAAVKSAVHEAVEQRSTKGEFELTPAEKQQVAALVAELEQHEIFDTTELRKLIDGFDPMGNTSVSEWLERLRQAIYHANNDQFRKLLDTARM